MISLNPLTFLVTATALNTVCVQAIDSEECRPGTYYDRVTGRCDSCDDICLNARLQGTESECRKHCPDYSATTTTPTTTIRNCPTGQYYDEAISRCDWCRVLCDDSDVQGTKDDCEQKCPQYRKETQTPDNEFKTAKIAGIAVAAILLTVIALVSLYGLMLFCCEHRLPVCLKTERCLPCMFKGFKKPIECTEASTSASESTLSSVDNVARPDVCRVLLEGQDQTSAFTELQFHRQCSRDENNT